MSRQEVLVPPPSVDTTFQVDCPSCQHPIDSHGISGCGFGTGFPPLCECLWGPNDIAFQRISDLADTLRQVFSTPPTLAVLDNDQV
jgi:hypothetical protein